MDDWKKNLMKQFGTKPGKSKKSNRNKNNSNKSDMKLADPLANPTAPYNFIPYDPKRVLIGFEPPKPGEETFSGSITCSLEALTPLLVAGPQEENKSRIFFTVDNNPVIPGSSIKGMLRSLIEAMSFSRLAPVNGLTVKPDNDLDFTQKLFGTVTFKGSAFKGRVAVSHSPCIEKVVFNRKDIVTVLGQPSATYLPHYIKQDKVKIKYKKRTNINEYASQLRGRKFYWHRGQVNNIEPANDNSNVQTTLRPLGSGSIFRFTLHLDGVTKEELGAILLALELPQDHAHKLGMGKSIGLGSARITIDEMHVLPSESKYGSISERINRDLQAETPDKENFNENCKDAFKKMILKRLNEPDTDYEDLHELKALRAMMDYRGRPPGNKTVMMPLQGNKGGPSYQKKAILQDALEVYGKGRNAP